VAAAACARHGAFAPGSVCNFQKGERSAITFKMLILSLTKGQTLKTNEY
jgi:hypothetical protein